MPLDICRRPEGQHQLLQDRWEGFQSDSMSGEGPLESPVQAGQAVPVLMLMRADKRVQKEGPCWSCYVGAGSELSHTLL